MNVIGLDIGGTKIFAGRYDADLNTVAETKIKTEADGGRDQVLQNLLTAVETVRDADTKAIGIAWAGFVDPQSGTIIKAPNIPALDGFALTDYITAQTGLPCSLENDARCFALGAYSQVAPAPQACLGVILGTGVGSGLVINGQIYHGANNFAGEIGHMPLGKGIAEDYFAAPGLQQRFQTERVSGISPAQAQTAIPGLVDWLTQLVFAYDPDHIVLGGGAAKHFWAQFESEINELLNKKFDQYPNKFNLQFYQGQNAGALGAAHLAKSQV